MKRKKKRKKKITKLVDLPNDAFSEISNFMSQPKDVKNIMFTSKYFYNLFMNISSEFFGCENVEFKLSYNPFLSQFVTKQKIPLKSLPFVRFVTINITKTSSTSLSFNELSTIFPPSSSTTKVTIFPNIFKLQFYFGITINNVNSKLLNAMRMSFGSNIKDLTLNFWKNEFYIDDFFPQVEKLNFNLCKGIIRSGIENLKNLTSLSICVGMGCNYSVFRKLKNLTSLDIISLVRPPAKDEDFHGFESLKKFSIKSCKGLTNELFKNMKFMEELVVKRQSKITLKILDNFKHLKYLSFCPSSESHLDKKIYHKDLKVVEKNNGIKEYLKLKDVERFKICCSKVNTFDTFFQFHCRMCNLVHVCCSDCFRCSGCAQNFSEKCTKNLVNCYECKKLSCLDCSNSIPCGSCNKMISKGYKKLSEKDTFCRMCCLVKLKDFECEICKEMICKLCSNVCTLCEKSVCGGCRTNCGNCREGGEFFCKECRKFPIKELCTRCRGDLCSNCMELCCKCGDKFCMINEDEENCVRVCSCERRLCASCSKNCLRCESLLCDRCISTPVCVKCGMVVDMSIILCNNCSTEISSNTRCFNCPIKVVTNQNNNNNV